MKKVPVVGAKAMSAIVRNNVRVSGSGKRIMMFAHGYGCDQSVWRWVVPAFEHDFTIITFDHVGAGQSDLSAYDPVNYETLAGYINDLLAICSEMQLRDIVYVGHSVSAMIGIMAAIEQPDVFSRLVLVAPSPCHTDKDNYVGGLSVQDVDELLTLMERNFVHWSATMTPIMMKNPENPELARELSNSFCRLDPIVAKQFARVTFLGDWRDRLALLGKPSLILQCQDDAIAPVEVGQYMHYTMPGSRLQIMAATGHCPHMSAPKETIVAIQNFVGVNANYA